MKKLKLQGAYRAHRARMGKTLGVAVASLCLVIWGAFCFVPAQQPSVIQDAIEVASDVSHDETASVETLAKSPSQSSDFGNDLQLVEPPEALSMEEAAAANIVVSKPGEILLSVDEDATAESVNVRLRSIDYITTEDVSDQDLSLGFVQVSLADGVTPEEASERLCAQGAQAQPNFVYYLMDDDIALQAADATTQLAGQVDAGSTASASVAQPEAVDEALDAQSYEIVEGAGLVVQGEADSASELSAQSLAIDDPQPSWMLDSVKAYNAWELAGVDDESSGFTPVTVAVIDSGCNVEHPDLKDNLKGAYNVLTGESGLSAMTDTNGHGTHVAGIVAAEANNGTGVAGTSYNAGLYPVKVMTGRSTDSANIVKAYKHIIDNAKTYNIRVINLSIGGSKTTEDFDDRQLVSYINRAYQNGILTVCAAGNLGAKTAAYKCFPCDFAVSVIGVINLEQSESIVKRSSGSNYNMENQTTKDLSAPGTNIESTWSDGSYHTESGTSMASPCVAGIAALMFGVNGKLTPYGATYILTTTATDLTPANSSAETSEGWDVYTGYGEVNAYEAVKYEKQYIESGSSVFVGGSLELQAAAANGSSYVWNCDSEGVVELAESGSSCTVTGVSAGEAEVSVTYVETVQLGFLVGTRNVTKSTTITVYDASISDAQTITYGSSTAYDVACNPSATWLWSSADEGIATVDDTDGTVTGAGVGTTTITATLLTNSSLTLSQTVKVTAADISKASVQVSSQEYTGSALTPKPTVTYDDEELEEGVDYTLSYKNNTALGTATVMVKGKGNFTGTTSAQFRITQGSQQMYRLYNPNSGEHFYTASASERDSLRRLGWRYEGMGWLAPKVGAEVYRLYNPNAGDHHYTMSASERDSLKKAGWRYEGVGWYSDPQKATPLYRQYNPNAKSGSHNYTTSKAENDKLVRLGWRAEGIGWYGL